MNFPSTISILLFLLSVCTWKAGISLRCDSLTRAHFIAPHHILSTILHPPPLQKQLWSWIQDNIIYFIFSFNHESLNLSLWSYSSILKHDLKFWASAILNPFWSFEWSYFGLELSSYAKFKFSTYTWRGDIDDQLNFIIQNTLKNRVVRSNYTHTQLGKLTLCYFGVLNSLYNTTSRSRILSLMRVLHLNSKFK